MFRRVFSSLLVSIALSGQAAGSVIVTVPSTTGWVDTGVILVEGSSLSVSATGCVCAPNCCTCPPGWGPNGIDAHDTGLCPSLNKMSLVGKIGGTCFFVGESYSGVVSVPGTLYLGVNDDDLSDNCGSFEATIDASGPGPAYEILSATFDRYVYQNGVDTAHLTVVTRSNWGTSSDLRIDASVNRYDGMPYHLGTDTFALSPGQQRISSFSFSLPFLEVPADFGGLAVLSADGEIVAMHPTSSFTGTPLSVEERTAQVEYLEGCRILPEGSGLIAEVGGAATHGTLASPLLSGAGATISILENTCREEAYRASGDECRANVSAGIVGIGMAALSVAVFATVVVSAGATLPLAVAWVGVGLSALSGATAIVGESTIAGWFCDDSLVKLVRRADLPIGEGDRARSLLGHVGELSDSTGVSFSIHTVIEGPVRARLELPVGYISRDSTSLYDAAAMVLAPDTLQWLAVGPSASRFSLGLDSLAAPTDSLWPKTLDLMATGAGPVFLGIALRAVGSTNTEVLYYPSVQVTDSTRMSVVIGDYGGFFPLEVDYDGDGVVDDYLFPEGPSAVDNEIRHPARPVMTLFPPRPNPTTGGATISLVATAPLSGVEIGIYDVAGRRVRKLAVGDIPSGVQQVVWEGRSDDGRHVASGIYYCVAECARDGTATIRLVVLR